MLSATLNGSGWFLLLVAPLICARIASATSSCPYCGMTAATATVPEVVCLRLLSLPLMLLLLPTLLLCPRFLLSRHVHTSSSLCKLLHEACAAVARMR